MNKGLDIKDLVQNSKTLLQEWQGKYRSKTNHRIVFGNMEKQSAL